MLQHLKAAKVSANSFSKFARRGAKATRSHVSAEGWWLPGEGVSFPWLFWHATGAVVGTLSSGTAARNSNFMLFSQWCMTRGGAALWHARIASRGPHPPGDGSQAEPCMIANTV